MAAFSTLLYIADVADAASIGSEHGADEQWPSVWLKHVGDLELVQLWSTSADLPPDGGRTLMGELVFQGSDEGPFVMRVPPEFVTALASLAEDRVPVVVTEWGRLEELAGWRPTELDAVVRELRQFCQQAIASGKSVLQLAEL